jgi:(1->4)-alpha-D-glucan 1-alpha-D-glucosylmutase
VHNPLYIDIEEAVRFLGDKKAAKLIGAETFQNRLCQLREGEYVPYEKIAQLKFEMLELLYRNFAIRDIGADTELGRSFLAFVEEEKDRIEVYSWFAALHEYFYEKNPAWWGWVLWPTEYRSPFSRKVREFVEEHLDRVQFYQFVEWLATSQLEQVSSYAEELGMGVGLYLDLALGSSQGGAGTWEDQSLYAFGVSMGAPADELAPQGQDWGLPPLNPKKLTESRYQIFIRVLRCAMRFSGAVRIDHVMQLMRLFWVPEGETAEHGAYVGYPLGDLLGILALESSRSRCLVIGEDLGTVPEEVRCGMDRYGVLSYKVLYFMKNYAEKSFLPPSAYPEKSLVVTSTHDLPSLRGFWEGVDLNIRRRLSLHSRTVQEMLEESREEDLAALKHLLIEHGFLSEEEAAAPLWQKKRMPSKLLQYVHLMLADTPSLFQAIQIEDLMGQAEQANLPGTVHEHPNWQRRLPMSLEQLERSPKVRTLLSGISKARNS